MKKLLLISLFLIICASGRCQQRITNFETSYRDGICYKGYAFKDKGLLTYITNDGNFKKNGEIILNIHIQNNSGKMINFNPRIIKAYYISKKGKTDLCVYDENEYKKKYYNRVFWFSGSNFEERTKTVSTKTRGDYGKQETKTEVKTQEYTGVRDENYHEADRFISGYAKRSDILNNEEYQGFIVTEKTKATEIVFEIPFDGNIYVIAYNLKED